MEIERTAETLGPGPPTPYDEDATGQPSSRTQSVESERDGFGTIVIELFNNRYHSQEVSSRRLLRNLRFLSARIQY